MAQRVKYMGASDIRRLEKGEDFGGRLAEPLSVDLEWSWDNNHVLDLDDERYSLSPEAKQLIVEEEDFKDVTDMARVPTNLAQQTWRGAPKTEPAAEGDLAGGSGSVAESPAGASGAEPTGGSTATSPSGGGRRRA